MCHPILTKKKTDFSSTLWRMIAPPTYLAADYYPIQGTTVFAYSQNVEGKKKRVGFGFSY
jgi:hypothetical protein